MFKDKPDMLAAYDGGGGSGGKGGKGGRCAAMVPLNTNGRTPQPTCCMNPA